MHVLFLYSSQMSGQTTYVPSPTSISFVKAKKNPCTMCPLVLRSLAPKGTKTKLWKVGAQSTNPIDAHLDVLNVLIWQIGHICIHFRVRCHGDRLHFWVNIHGGFFSLSLRCCNGDLHSRGHRAFHCKRWNRLLEPMQQTLFSNKPKRRPMQNRTIMAFERDVQSGPQSNRTCLSHRSKTSWKEPLCMRKPCREEKSHQRSGTYQQGMSSKSPTRRHLSTGSFYWSRAQHIVARPHLRMAMKLRFRRSICKLKHM